LRKKHVDLVEFCLVLKAGRRETEEDVEKREIRGERLESRSQKRKMRNEKRDARCEKREISDETQLKPYSIAQLLIQ